MLRPSTVRRIAVAAPQSPLLSSLVPAATRPTNALTLNGNPRCTPRRRYSSSKPSSPNDSPKGYPAGQVTTNPAQSSKQDGEKPAQSSKQGGEKRKRKAKDSRPERKLPSVPSTQDMPPESVALATFFSLHRPMSVTHAFPKAITDETFAQIFAPRAKSAPYNKVISTLARTVNRLEQPIRDLNTETQHATDGAVSREASGEPVHQISVRHADGTESSVYVQLDQMSGEFLPFRPPPIPHPLSGSEAEAAAESEDEELAPLEGAAVQQEPQTRIYKATLTLEETIDEHGNTRIIAHTPKLTEDTMIRRPTLHKIRRERIRGLVNSILAISVRRQRKLKMKKKKYKKLMKRTRNLRRKLDRV